MRKLLFIIFGLITITSYSQGVRGVLASKRVVRGAQPEVYAPDYIAQYIPGDSVLGFGNSIMIGIGSTPGSSTDWTTYTSAYMHKIRDTFGVIVDNYALSGMGVKPMVTEFYENGDSTNSDDHIILAGGYNDLRHRGGEADTLVPNQIYWGYNAAIANQFLKEWIVAGASTRTGSWTNLNANMNGKGKSYYSGNTSFEGLQSSHGTTYFDPPTASYTATGRYFVVGFVASDGSPTYEKNSFHIDTNGVLYATVNPNYQTSGAGPAWDVPQYEMPAAFVVDAGRSASHTIRIRPVTEGKVSLFDYFGVLNDTDAVKSVVILEIPKQTTAGYTADADFNNANDSVIMKGIYKQRQVADEWRARGYPVAIARTNDLFDPATHMSADLIHPNNTGQQILFDVLQTVIDSGVAPFVADSAQFNLTWTTSNESGWTTVLGNPNASILTGSQNGYTLSTIATGDTYWTDNGTAAAGYVTENTANSPFPAETGSGYFFHQSTTIPSGGNIRITCPNVNSLYDIWVWSNRPQTTDNRLTKIQCIDSAGGTQTRNSVNSAPSTAVSNDSTSQVISGGTWVKFSNKRPNSSGYIFIGVAAETGSTFGYVNAIKILRKEDL